MRVIVAKTFLGLNIRKLAKPTMLFAVSLGCCFLLGACAHLPMFGKSFEEDMTPPARTQDAESIKELGVSASPISTQQVEITQVLKQWKGLPEAKPHSSEICFIHPLAGGSKGVLTLDRGGRLLFWDSLSSKPRELLKTSLSVAAAAINGEDLSLVIVTPTNTAELFSLSQRKKVSLLDKLRSRVTSVAFLPKGESVFLGGADGKVYRWKGPDWDKQEVERYVGAATVISGLAFHPQGRVFFSGDWNGGLSAWLTYDSDVFEGKYDENLFGSGLFAEKAVRHKGQRSDKVSISHVVVSADGKYLFTALQDGRIELWQIRGFQKLGETAAHKGLIYSLAASASGDSVSSIGRDGFLRYFTWEIEDTGTPSKKIVWAKSFEASLPGGRMIAPLQDKKALVGEITGRVLEVSIGS